MSTYISKQIISGTKIYYHLTGDTDKEVLSIANRLRVKIPPKQHLRLHIDLNTKQMIRAYEFGANSERRTIDRGGE